MALGTVTGSSVVAGLSGAGIGISAYYGGNKLVQREPEPLGLVGAALGGALGLGAVAGATAGARNPNTIPIIGGALAAAAAGGAILGWILEG